MGFKIRCALILAVMLLSNYECSARKAVGGTGETFNGDGGNGGSGGTGGTFNGDGANSGTGSTGGTLNGDGGNELEPEDHINFAILKHPSISFTLITSIFAFAF